ncbi:MAG: TIGR00730 family Rossman fold protein [Spirochaetales bacterium]|nr:TIGR00730 family Rossman fold protein [Spirochaetales bacterium]
MNVCVFCSSSNSVNDVYRETARNLGKILAERGYNVIYGGGNNGLMGELALSVQGSGGKITGVIPKVFMDKGVAHDQCDELVVTRNLRERKQVMEQRSDAFIALPGGFGTLEELMEILTLKTLGLHNKPVTVIDSNDFYKYLFDFFRHMSREHFLIRNYTDMFYIAQKGTEAVSYIENYRPGHFSPQWS